MKFKITEINHINTRFGGHQEYYGVSNCGKYTQKLNFHTVRSQGINIGDIVSHPYRHWTTRLVERLSLLDINIELSCNYPWIYLDKVNNVCVDEIRNANHGYCIGYNEVDGCSYKKDLFSKIREILSQQTLDVEDELS